LAHVDFQSICRANNHGNMLEETATIRIGLLFELRSAETRPGEIIQVVGNWPALGSWQQSERSSGCVLQFLPTARLPQSARSMRVPVWIDVPGNLQEVIIEYKFMRDQSGLCGNYVHNFVSEDDIENRQVSLPSEDGSMWIISDAHWNSSTEDPIITRACLSKVLSRLGNLDLDCDLQREDSAPAYAILLTPRSQDGSHQKCSMKEDHTGALRKHYAIEDEFRALSPPRYARDNLEDSFRSNGSMHITWPRMQVIYTTADHHSTYEPERKDLHLASFSESEDDGSSVDDQQGSRLGRSMTASTSSSVHGENLALRDEIKTLRERLSKLEAARSPISYPQSCDCNTAGQFVEAPPWDVPCNRNNAADGHSAEVRQIQVRIGEASMAQKSEHIDSARNVSGIETELSVEHTTEPPAESPCAWQVTQLKSPHMHTRYFGQTKLISTPLAMSAPLPF